jgi:hypothetical protein
MHANNEDYRWLCQLLTYWLPASRFLSSSSLHSAIQYSQQYPLCGTYRSLKTDGGAYDLAYGLSWGLAAGSNIDSPIVYDLRRHVPSHRVITAVATYKLDETYFLTNLYLLKPLIIGVSKNPASYSLDLFHRLFCVDLSVSKNLDMICLFWLLLVKSINLSQLSPLWVSKQVKLRSRFCLKQLIARDILRLYLTNLGEAIKFIVQAIARYSCSGEIW